METDELDDAIAALQQQAATLRADLDRTERERVTLQRAHDQLAQKLRYPGTKFLVDLEYKLIHDATLTVPTGGVVTALIETLPGALHALYHLSAYCVDSSSPGVVVDGEIEGARALTLAASLQRVRQTAPLRIEVTLVVTNNTVADRDVAVRVWRRLGMGS